MFIELNTGELLLFDVFIIMKVRMFMQQRGTMRPIQNWRSSLYNTQKTELLVMHLNWSMVLRMVVSTAWIQFQKQKIFDLDI